MIVVDTNIIIYAVVKSEHTSLADQVLRTDPEWAAPGLWRSEFRNVVMRYIRNGQFDLDDAALRFIEAERLIAMDDIQIETSKVFELAMESDCTAYDCEFVFSAAYLGLPLVTSDKKVLSSFPDIAVSMTDFVN